jgi:FlaA1/EpsC-like NDP-sugar epimerase
MVMPLRMRNRFFIISDILIVILCVYLSFVIRVEIFNLQHFWSGLLLFAFIAALIFPIIFYLMGIYSIYWQYGSVDSILILISSEVVATILAAVISITISILVPNKFIIPRSIPIIFLSLVLILISGSRIMLRLIAHYQGSSQVISNKSIQRVLIMGAGKAGSMVIREIKRNPQLGINVVGLLDDDPEKHNMLIHGAKVLGNKDCIPQLVNKYEIDEIIIAMPSAHGKQVRAIVNICRQCNVNVKIMPGIYELLNGTIGINQLRNVQIEDLLRREPITTDLNSVRALIQGKKVMVTGGGGSIGSELCMQIFNFNPAELIILGHGENRIFEINKHFAINPTLKNNCHIIPIIADIRFLYRIQSIFEEYRPDIVFHAAAHKHVPLMELNPIEAIINNVIGTRNLLQASLSSGISQFIMISTDKVVNPTSIMGASKRVAELLAQQAAINSNIPFLTVRFGNVLGSTGSVVLTFKEQIAAGGPITITHPEMRRYFMTIPEAVQLVLQASVLGQREEVFILDMGEPVKIVDLAKDLIRLSGLSEENIEIIYTGTRPGEKLYEELFVDGEVYVKTLHDKIFLASKASSNIPSHLNEEIELLELAAQNNDRTEIIKILKRLIPEYQPHHDGEARG